MSLLLVLTPPFKKYPACMFIRFIGEASCKLLHTSSKKTQQQGELSLSFDCGHYLLLPAKITTR